MDPMPHAQSQSPFPLGTPVFALNGEELGAVEAFHPHFFLVRHADDTHADLQVPTHAIADYDGKRLMLLVNREALSVVDDEESITHMLHHDEH